MYKYLTSWVDPEGKVSREKLIGLEEEVTVIKTYYMKKKTIFIKGNMFLTHIYTIYVYIYMHAYITDSK